MNFRPEMVEAIRRGQKTETRRVANLNPRSPWCRERCGVRMGKRYAICPGRGKAAVGYLELTRAPELSLIENITDLGASREGFDDRDAFLAYFAEMHPHVSVKAEVWVIAFKVTEWVTT